MDLRQIEALIGAELGTRTDIVAPYLFGSRARGTARADSDVDRGILHRVTPAPTLLGQPFELQAALSSKLGAAQDAASHIVSDDRLGEPKTNFELFATLAGSGWLEPRQLPPLRAAIGFRNIMVHGYTAVDPAVVRDVVLNHLGDIAEFVSAIRGRIDTR